MTREQENTVERMGVAYGRLLIRDGYADGHIGISIESGRHWTMSESGQLRDAGNDWTPESAEFRHDHDAQEAII